MPERLDLILYTVNSLHSAAITLTEYARELPADPEARLTDFEDVPELLAESLVTALEALPDDRLTEDRSQLLGALRRYLDGWTA
jgi:hypothetical protein